MGGIVFWALVRIAVFIPTMWLLSDIIDYQLWWAITLMGIYGVIIHPAAIQYRFFVEENKKIVNNTLCSSCKHFDETAILCLIHDKHPTLDNLPCEGMGWEPGEKDYEQSQYYP